MLEEKTIKFEILEKKLQEMEINHQNELIFMQKELNRMKEEEQNQNAFSNIASGSEHLNTYTQRKINKVDNIFKSKSNNATPISINYNSQKHFISQHKVMSISNNSLGNNIMMTGPQSTKKKATSIRKLKGEIQKNLLKGYIVGKADSESNGAMLELSTRTPDKTNPELSPYMMDFYKKKRSMYDESVAGKIRSSSNNMKYMNQI